ncbi:SDR family NAD(P)-dependent oxidoreductase [Mucisphaera calidilacus]|uniref:Sepiapterin reductase n=1 Tax=Mucisphaera calidilacus TaxID=2527982 RepID=A0A518BWC5_9BACT|nr:SDR family oxidoreductase [Mucisphaera calidilacus]QDU71282.1 Sepiapterin reductase [Mucisphaera calidilacus]
MGDTAKWPPNGQPVCVVTGAGSGVGRDVAYLMAEAGWRVVLVGRTAAKLQQTIAMIREDMPEKPELAWLEEDISSAEACERVIAGVIERFGQVDALANVAGDAPLQPIGKITDEIYERCMGVNLKSVIFLTQACWPHFKKAGGGAIASVSSMASLDPFTGFNVYAAAKAGVNLFTKATADEGKRINVTAFSVAPGAIETPMLRANFNEKMIPADKTLDPVVVAGLVRDGLLREGRFENGETFSIASP